MVFLNVNKIIAKVIIIAKKTNNGVVRNPDRDSKNIAAAFLIVILLVFAISVDNFDCVSTISLAPIIACAKTSKELLSVFPSKIITSDSIVISILFFKSFLKLAPVIVSILFLSH